MPNPIMPGAIWDPGKFGNYGAGRTSMQTVKVHCTAGNDSYGICKNNGLCQWLIGYEGELWQFAPADALCYDSGPYNTWGPGYEIERPVTGGAIRPGLSEFRDMSPAQLDSVSRLTHWLVDEWGFRLDLYDGPRYQCPSDFGGFVNHGDIESQRSDGVTRPEWDAITQGDDMDEQQTRDLIDKHLFDERDTPYGISRMEGYMRQKLGYGISRIDGWVLDALSNVKAEARKRLGL